MSYQNVTIFFVKLMRIQNAYETNDNRFFDENQTKIVVVIFKKSIKNFRVNKFAIFKRMHKNEKKNHFQYFFNVLLMYCRFFFIIMIFRQCIVNTLTIDCLIQLYENQKNRKMKTQMRFL